MRDLALQFCHDHLLSRQFVLKFLCAAKVVRKEQIKASSSFARQTNSLITAGQLLLQLARLLLDLSQRLLHLLSLFALVDQLHSAVLRVILQQGMSFSQVLELARQCSGFARQRIELCLELDLALRQVRHLLGQLLLTLLRRLQVVLLLIERLL